MSSPVVIGRYVLHQEIASGDTGTVCLAKAVGEGGFAKPVAVKRLHSHLARHDDFATTLLSQARLVARIRHANVVSIIDVVREGDELLVVMEYVHGAPLSLLIDAARKARRPIPAGVVAAVAVGVLNGLAAAHDASGSRGTPLDIVHRDVSPRNILLGADGLPRLIDFGVAPAFESSRRVPSDLLARQQSYAAAMQGGTPLDRRVDLWAVAVVMCEMLTLQAPHLSDVTVSAGMAGQRGAEAAFDPVLRTALARASEPTFATAQAFAQAIEGAVHPASPDDVGAWVRLHAKALLRERRRRLREVDADTTRGSDIAPPSDATPQDVLPASSPAPSAALDDVPRVQPLRAARVAVGCALLVVGVGVAAWASSASVLTRTLGSVAVRPGLAPRRFEVPVVSASVPAVLPPPRPRPGARRPLAAPTPTPGVSTSSDPADLGRRL